MSDDPVGTPVDGATIIPEHAVKPGSLVWIQREVRRLLAGYRLDLSEAVNVSLSVIVEVAAGHAETAAAAQAMVTAAGAELIRLGPTAAQVHFELHGGEYGGA